MKRTVKSTIMTYEYGKTRFDRDVCYGMREVSASANIYYPTGDERIALFAVSQPMNLGDVYGLIKKAGYRPASLEEFEGKITLTNGMALVALQTFRVIGEERLTTKIYKDTEELAFTLFLQIFDWVSNPGVRFVGIKL